MCTASPLGINSVCPGSIVTGPSRAFKTRSSSTPPKIPVPEAQPSHIVDPHAAWSRVLSENVDDKGRVDFKAIAADKEDLETWVAYVAVTDPADKPDDFPEDRKAAITMPRHQRRQNRQSCAVLRTIATARDLCMSRVIFRLPICRSRSQARKPAFSCVEGMEKCDTTCL